MMNIKLAWLLVTTLLLGGGVQGQEEEAVKDEPEKILKNDRPVTPKTRSLDTSSPYKPHILYIVMDDLGYADLGFQGSGIYTPMIAELKNQGLWFNRFYVLPTCTMTRTAIMTGKLPYRQGLYEVVRGGSTDAVPLTEEMLPEMLKRAGYVRKAVGKWHLGHARWANTPTFRGFDSFFGFHAVGGQDHYKHADMRASEQGIYDMRNETGEFCGPGCSEIVNEQGVFSSTLFGREAVNVVNNHNPDDPLFLYLAFLAVQ